MIQCEAVLFDLDGVLIDSAKSIERSWTRWAGQRRLDALHVLSVAHGRRTRETLVTVAPDLDPEQEIAELARMELGDLEGTTAMPGAVNLLEAMPPERWAVVTSGLRDIALARIRHAGLPMPWVLITADQIEQGKPSPEGYMKAAVELGTPPGKCVVVEDTPPGVEAGRAAGMPVVGVLTTYGREALRGADFVIAGVHAMAIEVSHEHLGINLDLATGEPD